MSQTDLRAVLTVPANNTTMQPELEKLCPGLAPLGVARVPLPGETVNAETLPAYMENTFAAVAPFLARHPQILIYGCTAAGFLLGREESELFADELRRRSGAAMVSTGAAMVDVLRHEGVDGTAVVTPFLKDVNDGLCRYLASAGITVETLASFEARNTDELGRITEEQVRELALRTVTSASKSVFIACSQLPTLGILEPLRERLSIPVWSSISATAWAANKVLDAGPGEPAAGSRQDA